VTVELEAIGVVRGGRAEIFEDSWGEVTADIELDPDQLEPSATLGLEEFSHIEVVYHFDRATKTRRGSEHPRGNPDSPRVGVLAGHGPMRPNHLGVSRCELVAVDGLRITVRGLDALDGTPVLDIKPWVTEFAPRTPTRQPQWITELMRAYY
jgi:tRNA-Thr(GGU) m(6)t(6)A37 methyltransferase TsaA